MNLQSGTSSTQGPCTLTLQSGGNLVLTNILLETVWSSASAVSWPLYPAWPGFSGSLETVPAPPQAAAVTAAPPASVNWPLGSVIQCLAPGGQSLGSAYTAIQASISTETGPTSFECLYWTQV